MRGKQGKKEFNGVSTSPIKTPAPPRHPSPVKTFTLDAQKLKEIEALTATPVPNKPLPPKPSVLDKTSIISSGSDKTPFSEDSFAARTERLLRSSRPSSAGKGGRSRRRGIEDSTVVAQRLGEPMRNRMGGSLDGTFTFNIGAAGDATFSLNNVLKVPKQEPQKREAIKNGSGNATFVLQEGLTRNGKSDGTGDYGTEAGPDPHADAKSSEDLNATFFIHEPELTKEDQQRTNFNSTYTETHHDHDRVHNETREGALEKERKPLSNQTPQEETMITSEASSASRALVDSCCTDTGLGSSMPSSMVLSMGASQEMDAAGVFGPSEPPPATAKMPQISPIEEKEERMDVDTEGTMKLD